MSISINYSLYKTLSLRGKTFLLNENPIASQHFLKSAWRQFTNDDIQEYQKITSQTEFKTIDYFEYKYQLDQPLFQEWQPEQIFLKNIKMMLNYQRASQTSNEITNFITKNKLEIDEKFHKQPLFQRAITHLDKIKNEIKIISQALAIKKNMETEVNKLDQTPNLSFQKKKF